MERAGSAGAGRVICSATEGRPMKYLIVNGDDFGASHGINRGIVEAHQRGILTSTSLLVDTPWSQEAASLVRAAPDLSVGLHAHLRSAEQEWGGDSCHSEILRQWG